MLEADAVLGLIAAGSTWPGYALARHNDAKHPLHAINVLADFGLRATDPGIEAICGRILARQDHKGALLTRLRLHRHFGGLEGDYDSWMLCDWPVLVHALLAFGLGDESAVQSSVNFLQAYNGRAGWSCAASSMLGPFRGPGSKADPCPMATLYALKAFSLLPAFRASEKARASCEILLAHWQEFATARELALTGMANKPRKLYLFGVGSDYHQLKFPLVWYDILHVSEVLSRYEVVRDDQRFLRMVWSITEQGDALGRYTATSMYRAWKDWSFADKTRPSPWLTLLVWRILKRLGQIPPNDGADRMPDQHKIGS